MLEFILSDDALDDHFTARIKTVLEEELSRVDHVGGEVNVIIADDRYLHELNRRYRHRDRPTDVLSFSFLDTSGEEREGDGEYAVGDIYISLDRAEDQAAEAGHSLDREVALLAIHGLLHLLGYDHEHEAEARLMENLEAELILRYDRAIPGGDVFA